MAGWWKRKSMNGLDGYTLTDATAGTGGRALGASGQGHTNGMTPTALAAPTALISAAQPRRVIDLRQVIKSYPTAAGEYLALKGVSLAVDAGEFVAVVGKSGSGKSTLSNMITGIDRPTSGEVLVTGTPVHTLSEDQIAQWRGRNVGVVFQFFQLLPTLSVLENVMLPMDFCNTFRGQRHERAMHLLAQVDMESQANKLPTALSGGQQQRVAIARALANDPALIVADEPTGNLDSRTAEAVFHLFETLTGAGKTIVMVTHDDDLARRASRAVTLLDGQIITDTRHFTPHVVVDEVEESGDADSLEDTELVVSDQTGESSLPLMQGSRELLETKP